jgi:hypothetical protein
LIPDECDLAGSSSDVNNNSVPDECEVDCNKNGLPDSYEIVEMLVLDCDNNAVPDSCDIDGGSASDCNGNGVPDSCELAAVLPANAVQWRVEDGGNGHWYALLPNTSGASWMDCAAAAEAVGGHLVTLTSATENQFVYGLYGASAGCHLAIGLKQRMNSAEPDDGWGWITGEPLVFTNWANGRPNDYGGEDFGELQYDNNYGWNDWRASPYCGGIVEWDFTPPTDCDDDGVPDSCGDDCNDNGVPDACDIANGETDKDADGVLDSCEYARGDFDLSGCVEGIDLSFILATWGFTDVPVGDLNGDGIIGALDLTIILANWGCYD